jgi:TldD protein
VRDACAAAIDAALGAGASYADARAVELRAQDVETKNRTVDTLADSESEGIGVRVLVDGAWGFACDRRIEPAAARDAALRAAAFARAAGARRPRTLAPLEPQRGSFRAPIGRDPFEVPLADKVELCLRVEEAMAHEDVRMTQASLRALREHKLFMSSEGSELEHELYECGAGIDAVAVGDGQYQIRSYPSAFVGSSAQAGWEYVESLELEREAPRIAEEAAALLRADVCPEGVTTVVLDSDQMTNQIHESVGHPTELDRIYLTEAAYAGTSFLKPGDLGSFRYGSELMNITSDPTTPLGLGTYGWDDEGVPAAPEAIVEAGVLRGFLSSRETAAELGQGVGGSVRADSWNRLPLIRIGNLNLAPGEGSLEDLIAGVDEGVFLKTNKSWSIDDKRLNFQFGSQIAWEIKNGKLGRMLRDATYTGVTPVFWGSLDAVAGPEAWTLYGFTNCGKGQPGQTAHVSHGTAPARFRNVQVGVRA